ncbi:hypothetical protein HDU76_002609 [Blyttiomyces sp. JEL0837]|nr:hypothetical protein HDU76_002609 [Blyttiomyces sp. JEL0837]
MERDAGDNAFVNLDSMAKYIGFLATVDMSLRRNIQIGAHRQKGPTTLELEGQATHDQFVKRRNSARESRRLTFSCSVSGGHFSFFKKDQSTQVAAPRHLSAASSRPHGHAMESLLELHRIRTLTGILDEHKATVIELSVERDKQQGILDELGTERLLLLTEKEKLVKMLGAVQRDLDEVTKAEESLSNECVSLAERINEVRSEEYEPLRAKVDELRKRHGLPPTKPLQEEIEEERARRLQERRERWRESGILDVDPSPAGSASSSAPNSPGNRDRKGKKTRRK